MQRDKSCYGKEMACAEGKCYGDVVPADDYHWWSTVVKVGYRCWTNPKRIMADDLKTNLFGTRSSCRAKDLYCILSESVVVWTKDVIHDCPFERIDVLKFVFYENMNKLVFNREQRLLFVINSKFMSCNSTMYTTNENIYLATEPNKIPQRSDAEKEIDLDSSRMLGLAESDLSNWDSWNRNVELEYEACLLMNSNLEALRSTANMFHLIYLPSDNSPMIIYANHRSLFKPSCIVVQEIEVVTNSNVCYHDILVRIRLSENRTMAAFLTVNNILRYNSEKIDCKLVNYYVVIKAADNTEWVIERFENSVVVKPIKSYTGLDDGYIIVKHKSLSRFEVHHYDKILEETDLEHALNYDAQFIFNQDGSLILADSTKNVQDSTSDDLSVEIWKKIKQGTVTIMITCILIILGILVTIGVIWVVWTKGIYWCWNYLCSIPRRIFRRNLLRRDGRDSNNQGQSSLITNTENIGVASQLMPADCVELKDFEMVQSKPYEAVSSELNTVKIRPSAPSTNDDNSLHPILARRIPSFKELRGTLVECEKQKALQELADREMIIATKNARRSHLFSGEEEDVINQND